MSSNSLKTFIVLNLILYTILLIRQQNYSVLKSFKIGKKIPIKETFLRKRGMKLNSISRCEKVQQNIRKN